MEDFLEFDSMDDSSEDPIKIKEKVLLEIEEDMRELDMIRNYTDSMDDDFLEYLNNLEQSKLEIFKQTLMDKFPVLRDAGVVVGGGLLGLGGFLMSPLVGIGTFITGISVGAAVYGIHHKNNKIELK